MRFPTLKLRVLSRLAWPAVAVSVLMAATLERSPQGSLRPGTRVREQQATGAEWTWEVIGRTDDGRYELRRGKIRGIAEPREVVPVE